MTSVTWLLVAFLLLGIAKIAWDVYIFSERDAEPTSSRAATWISRAFYVLALLLLAAWASRQEALPLTGFERFLVVAGFFFGLTSYVLWDQVARRLSDIEQRVWKGPRIQPAPADPEKTNSSVAVASPSSVREDLAQFGDAAYHAKDVIAELILLLDEQSRRPTSEKLSRIALLRDALRADHERMVAAINHASRKRG